ncbi:MAG: septal ring lytic transglycosylase RlpA family protein [Bryobacterales bacterium]|nr:septal ring lytic transglycosylase RlpA family protein [Bryobacterales bacterium]
MKPRKPMGLGENRKRAAAIAKAAALIALGAALAATGCGGRRPAKAVTPKIGTQQKGIASWYGYPYHGRRTASGEVYDMEQMTAAHRNWVFGTWVRVQNLDNGEETVVRITDRGPFVRGRIIDLSRAAARDVEMINAGIAKVRLTVIPPPANPPQPPPVPAATTTSRRQPKQAKPQPPAPAVPPPVTVTQLPKGRWGVQVGSFREKSGAAQLRDALVRSSRVANISLSSNGYWRVVIGIYRTAAEAERLKNEIHGEYPDAFVVRFDDMT